LALELESIHIIELIYWKTKKLGDFTDEPPKWKVITFKKIIYCKNKTLFLIGELTCFFETIWTSFDFIFLQFFFWVKRYWKFGLSFGFSINSPTSIEHNWNDILFW